MPAPLEVGRRSRKDARRLSEFSRHHARNPATSRAGGPRNSIDHQILALIADFEIDAQRRMAFKKLRQTRDHLANPEAGRDGDPKHAAQFPGAPDDVIGFLERRQQGLDPRE